MDLDIKLEEIFLDKDEDYDSDAPLLIQEFENTENVTEEEDNSKEKCGEILLENRIIVLVCQFCHKHYRKLDEFTEHMFSEHIVSYNVPLITLKMYEENVHHSTTESITNNNNKENESEKTQNKETESSKLDLNDDEEYIPSSNDSSSSDTEDNENINSTSSASNKSILIPKTSLRDDGLFLCNICQRVYAQFSALQNHFKKHTIKRKYMCMECVQSFESKRYLECHKLAVHSENRFNCTNCTQKFKWLSGLRKHLKLVHNKEDKDSESNFEPIVLPADEKLSSLNKTLCFGKDGMYSCPICIQKYSRFDNLRNHYRYCQINRQNKTELIKIDKNIDKLTNNNKRKKITKNKVILVLPEQSLDKKSCFGKDGMFACPICIQKYSRFDNLQNHYKYCKINEKNKTEITTKPTKIDKNMKCQYCDKYFNSKSNLKQHEFIIHNDDRNYKCNVCEQVFKYRSTLKRHLTVHFGNVKIVCDYCDKKFLQTSEKIEHENLKHIVNKKKPFRCENCLITFRRRFLLNEHSTRCAGNKKDNNTVHMLNTHCLEQKLNLC